MVSFGFRGILEYFPQTNNNFDFVEEDMVYKYFDDASILEIVNLLSIGLVPDIWFSPLFDALERPKPENMPSCTPWQGDWHSPCI